MSSGLAGFREEARRSSSTARASTQSLTSLRCMEMVRRGWGVEQSRLTLLLAAGQLPCSWPAALQHSPPHGAANAATVHRALRTSPQPRSSICVARVQEMRVLCRQDIETVREGLQFFLDGWIGGGKKMAGVMGLGVPGFTYHWRCSAFHQIGRLCHSGTSSCPCPCMSRGVPCAAAVSRRSLLFLPVCAAGLVGAGWASHAGTTNLCIILQRSCRHSRLGWCVAEQVGKRGQVNQHPATEAAESGGRRGTAVAEGGRSA